MTINLSDLKINCSKSSWKIADPTDPTDLEIELKFCCQSYRSKLQRFEKVNDVSESMNGINDYLSFILLQEYENIGDQRSNKQL